MAKVYRCRNCDKPAITSWKELVRHQQFSHQVTIVSATVYYMTPVAERRSMVIMGMGNGQYTEELI